jgi:hypothetical protein
MSHKKFASTLGVLSYKNSGMNNLGTVSASRLLALLLQLALPAALQAQFNYTVTNGTITITGYTGPGGVVNIPGTINGLPVTAIGNYAFDNIRNITSVAIPDGVTSIGALAFNFCMGLTRVTLGNGLTNIGESAFNYCTNLASVEIPNSVTNIGSDAFSNCGNLSHVTVGNGVASIGTGAFGACASLATVYFLGNAPSLGLSPFSGDSNATVYYQPGTSGWGTSFGQLPTVPWTAQMQTSGASFGVWTNQFGFVITWTSNMTVVVQACANLSNPAWSPVQTNTLTGGSSYFSDPQWKNYPRHFYRIAIPPP